MGVGLLVFKAKTFLVFQVFLGPIIFLGPRFLGFLKALKVFDFLNLWLIILQLFGFSFFFPGHLVLIIRFFGFIFRFLLLIVGL